MDQEQKTPNFYRGRSVLQPKQPSWKQTGKAKANLSLPHLGQKTPRARFWKYKRICKETKHSIYWEAQVWFTQEIRVSAGRAPMSIPHWDLAQAPSRISATETVSSDLLCPDLLPQLPHGHPDPRPEDPARGHRTVGAAQEAAGRSHQCESSTSRNPTRAVSVEGG